MTTPSDSRFFPNECICIKKEVQNDIFIECAACINGFGKWNNGRECSCEYHKIKQLHCPTCAADRDRLDEMHAELDILQHNLSTTIKSYASCDDDIHAIVDLSKRMRQCNHDLLSRLVSHKIDDEYAVMSEPDEKDMIEQDQARARWCDGGCDGACGDCFVVGEEEEEG